MIDFLCNYAVLKVIWWILLGCLFWGIAIANGLDLGVACLVPSAFKTDEEKRILLNTVGPVWEGNQVWFILGAGAIFAAWPPLYATIFSGLYIPLFAVLLGFMLRPVSFKFRAKINDPTWRKAWDIGMGLGGVLPAVGFGVLLGTLVSGLAFSFDDNMRLTVGGGLGSIMHPVPLVSAALWVLLFVNHGGLYLLIKTKDTVKDKVQRFLPTHLWLSCLAFFGLLWIWQVTIPDYVVIAQADGPVNPFAKSIMLLDPKGTQSPLALPDLPWMLLSFLVFTFLTFLIRQTLKRHPMKAFILNAIRMGVVIVSMGAGAFPVILPSTIDLQSSLTVWDASASRLTLLIMFVAAAIFVPIMVATACWVYKVLRGPVTAQDIKKKSNELY